MPLSPRIKKFSLYSFGALLIVGLATAGVGTVYLCHSLPHYNGTAAVAGLSGEARVLRDAHGVPHIFAANINDAARALGYAHASDRMFQMDMQRRAGQGRLSEVVGVDTLDIDKFIRTLGFYNLATSSFVSFSPEAQEFYRAYAEGVNAWLRQNGDRLPPEFAILGYKPEAWRPEDSIVWAKLMALQLSANYKLELLRSAVAKRLPPDMMQTLFPSVDAPAPITLLPHSVIPTNEQKKSEIFAPLRQDYAPQSVADNVSPWASLGSITGLGHAASNEWVIAGSRTASGKPILANDPHLGLDAPILWYLVRIVTPDFWIKGASVPGNPVILLGQNDHIAWGFTTTNSDTEDLFIETLDDKNPDTYHTPKGSEKFTTHDEIIRIKGRADVTLHVRSTRHGSVLSDIDVDMAEAAGKGHVMALAFTGLGDKDTTSEALMYLNRARNWNEFNHALQLFQSPTQNIVYADREGHIGYVNPGLVPVRKKGEGDVPVDGASGEYDWLGNIPFTQIPRLYDPKAGFVFNANNQVTNRGITPYLITHDWDEPYRAQQLQTFFDTLTQHTLETSAMMQNDTTSPIVPLFMPYLQRIHPKDEATQQALELLKAWDGRMQADSPAALIFEAWLYRLHERLLVNWGDYAGHYGEGKKPSLSVNEKSPYAAGVLLHILESNDAAWCGAPCDDVTAEELHVAVDSLGRKYGTHMENWRWGNEHISILKNKVMSHVPLLSGLSDLSMPSDGGYYTLDRGESADVEADHPFLRRHAGGYRGIYDLADPDQSRFVIATGESGHVLSSHYGDLAPLWNKGGNITLSGTADELRAQGGGELVLHP